MTLAFDIKPKNDYHNHHSSTHPSQLSHSHKLIGLSLLKVGNPDSVKKIFLAGLPLSLCHGSIQYADFCLQFLKRHCVLLSGDLDIVVKRAPNVFYLESPTTNDILITQLYLEQCSSLRRVSITRAIKMINEQS